MITKQKYVTFYSPGSFVSESSTKKISKFDTKLAAKMAKTVEERHGAKPYGFIFHEQEEGNLTTGKRRFKIEPKETYKSGTYFLGGKILTLESIPDIEQNSILKSNIKNNGYKAVVENTNSWKITLPFTENDVLLNKDGNFICEGKDLN